MTALDCTFCGIFHYDSEFQIFFKFGPRGPIIRVSIGLRNGLAPSREEPLPEQVMTPVHRLIFTSPCLNNLTHCPLGDLIKIFKTKTKLSHAIFPSDSLQMFIEIALEGFLKNSSLHWLRLWLDAVRQQAITWANVDQDPCRHGASIDHNELTSNMWLIIL